MRKLSLLLLALPLVLLWTYGCDEQRPTEPEAPVATAGSGTAPALFDKKAPPVLPRDCAAGQILEWDGAAWSCVDFPTIPPYVGGLEMIESQCTAAASNPSTSCVAICPTGKQVLGGGYRYFVTGLLGQLEVFRSQPMIGGITEKLDRWSVGVANYSAQSVTFWSYAVCATIE